MRQFTLTLLICFLVSVSAHALQAQEEYTAATMVEWFETKTHMKIASKAKKDYTAHLFAEVKRIQKSKPKGKNADGLAAWEEKYDEAKAKHKEIKSLKSVPMPPTLFQNKNMKGAVGRISTTSLAPLKITQIVDGETMHVQSVLIEITGLNTGRSSLGSKKVKGPLLRLVGVDTTELQQGKTLDVRNMVFIRDGNHQYRTVIGGINTAIQYTYLGDTQTWSNAQRELISKAKEVEKE